MTRKAGNFPRVQLQNKIERDLEHRVSEANKQNKQRDLAQRKVNESREKAGLEAEQRRSTLLYSCKIDEHRTSKQNHKLRALVDNKRSDKTNPKADTVVWTTQADGTRVSFTIDQTSRGA